MLPGGEHCPVAVNVGCRQMEIDMGHVEKFGAPRLKSESKVPHKYGRAAKPLSRIDDMHDEPAFIALSLSLRAYLGGKIPVPTRREAEARLQDAATGAGSSFDIGTGQSMARVQDFKDFDAILDFVNPVLANCAEMLEETTLSLSLTLAEMEARSERIDRTQAESRAIIDSLTA